MKRNMLVLIITVTVLCAAVAFSSAENTDTRIYPTAITVPESLVVDQNDAVTVTPQITPVSASVRLSVYSDDPGIAEAVIAGIGYSVNIIGISEGKTTVTILTDNGISAQCEVTVVGKSQPEKITIPAEYTMRTGKTWDIPITLYPPDSSAGYRIYTDSNIVSVNTTGSGTGVRVHARYPGQATVRVTTNNGLTARCIITVEEGTEPTEISIPEHHTMYEGESWDIPIALQPADSGTSFSVSASDSQAVRLTTTGGGTGCRVYAVRGGETVVTVSTENGISDTCSVTVLHVWSDNIQYDDEMAWCYICKNCECRQTISFSTLPGEIKTVTDEMLYDTAISALYVPEGTTRICDRAFANCASLKVIYIPDSVTYIAEDAFSGCSTHLRFIVKRNSAAEKYAQDHGIVYLSADE